MTAVWAGCPKLEHATLGIWPVLAGLEVEELGVLVDESGGHGLVEELRVVQHVLDERDVCLHTADSKTPVNVVFTHQ